MVGAQPPARPSYARARGSGRRGHAWLWGLRAARGSSNRWVGVDYAQIGFRAPALSRALSIQCTGRARPCLTDDDDDDNDDNGDNDDDDACLVWCLRLPPAPLIQATTGSASLPSVRFAIALCSLCRPGRNPSTWLARRRSASDSECSCRRLLGMGRSTRYALCCRSDSPWARTIGRPPTARLAVCRSWRLARCKAEMCKRSQPWELTAIDKPWR